MKTSKLIIVILAGFAFFLTSCDSPPPSSEDDLLVEYRSHALLAQNSAESLAAQHTPEDELASFHNEMSGHLVDLEELRHRMSVNCQNTSECVTGGGATGHVSHGCMHSGYYLSEWQIQSLEKFENEIRDMMDSVNQTCPQGYDSVDECIVDHAIQMGEHLGDMAGFCSSMMSSNRKDDNFRQGMCGSHMNEDLDDHDF